MGNAPTVGTDGFSGVASGCVASVSPKSTGWCVEAGETWNGLILQYLPFTYEDWAEENSITGAWNEENKHYRTIDGHTVQLTILPADAWFRMYYYHYS